MKEGPGKHPKPTAPTESQIADHPHACQEISPLRQNPQKYLEHDASMPTLNAARPPWGW